MARQSWQANEDLYESTAAAFISIGMPEVMAKTAAYVVATDSATGSPDNPTERTSAQQAAVTAAWEWMRDNGHLHSWCGMTEEELQQEKAAVRLEVNASFERIQTQITQAEGQIKVEIAAVRDSVNTSFERIQTQITQAEQQIKAEITSVRQAIRHSQAKGVVADD